MVLIIMLIMMFFGFLALAVTFTIRIIILWALVIVSPLYVISKLFPFTSSIGSQWEGKFFKYATLQVGVAFFLTLAAMSAGLIGERIFPNLSGAATGSVGTLHAGGLNTWSDYLQLAFIMAMVYAAVFTAAKSDYGTGLIDRIASYGRQPLQGVRLGARGVGGAFGFLGTAGRRLQAVQRPGLIGGAARFVGGFIAAPSNVYEGGKAVVGELKRGAEERKTRFGLAAGEKLARPFGGAVREKLKARVEEEQQKIVTQREADMRLRLSIPEIQGRLKAAADTRNAYEYMAAATALSKLGALDFTATTGRKIVGDDGKERAETIKDRLFAQELARTGNREQAKNAVDALERANQSVFESELKQGYDFAKRTDDKKAIRAKLEEFVARGNKAGALGVIQAGFEGRLEGGAAEAMEYWERVQREGKLNITGDDRRRFAKDIAKDSIATVGIMMGRESGEQKYLNDVFQVAKEIGVVASGAATYSDAIGGASSDKEKEVLEKIISSLAATGKVIDSTGRQRFLSESTAGRSLLDEVAKAQLNAFGAVKLSGDDGNLSGMVQLVDTGALARSHTMDSAGNFTADSKMVRETFKALIENTLRTTGEAKKYADDQLTKFQEAYLGNMTSQAKREGVAKVFGEMKSVISKDVDATAAKAKMDEVFNNMAALAKEKELAEFREKARIQAEEAERAKIVGGGSKTTLT